MFQLEEAEWVGLKPWEAVAKQAKIEAEQLEKEIKPLKEVYMEETFQRLHQNPSHFEISPDQ
jgi:hypothetical protein